jgi:NADH-quinone oxidoreductase subunit A
MAELIPILLMIGTAALVAGGMYVTSHILGPNRPGKIKLGPYESGKDPIGEAHIRFPIRFYIIAMLFVLFDIEIVFFYPWAVVYKQLLSFGNFILIEMLVFIGLLFVGYFYAWKKGALEWE